MQKHSDRLDKRPPITGGAGAHNGMGLGPESYWPKLDPMAMYGYQQPLMDHPRLAELDGRDYSSVWDPRNSSAFTPLAATATNTNSSPAEANKTSAYDSFKTNGQVGEILMLEIPINHELES